jgi:hypothetical protein
MAVRDTVDRLIADVYAGRIHPRVAAGLAPLLNLQLRAIETSDFERRLLRVEKLLAKTDADDRARNSRERSEHVESSYEGIGFPPIEKTPPVELE